MIPVATRAMKSYMYYRRYYIGICLGMPDGRLIWRYKDTFIASLLEAEGTETMETPLSS